jgi:outer membrane immunogenic protein
MRRFVVALTMSAVVVLGIAPLASADGVDRVRVRSAPVVVAAPSWSGCYGGGNVGYSWGRASTDITDPPIAVGVDTIPGKTHSGSANLTGIVGGGQLGCNWQPSSSRWVFGLETDFQYSGEKGSWERNDPNSFVLVPGDVTSRGNVNLDPDARISWFGTFRGRIGYDWNNLLFYGTGGLAYGRVSYSGIETDTGLITVLGFRNRLAGVIPYNQTTSMDGSNVKTGFALGGGVEGALSGNWTWKAEYIYIDLGSLNVSAMTPAGTLVTTSTKFTDNIVRLGLNYRFWSAGR